MQTELDRRDARASGQGGFTIIEMTVAMTILAGVLLAMAIAMYGGLRALGASRQRSAFVEIANAEMERLRATPYNLVGVSATDLQYELAYETDPASSGLPRRHVNRDAVIVASGAPAAVSTVTTSAVQGIPLPYTVHRWVTWSDTSGGGAHQFKRLEVKLVWTENQRTSRSLTLSSVLYPGGIGAPTAANNLPTAVMAPPSPSTATVGETFTFDGTGSSDPDATDTLTYSWNFGDGQTGTGATVTHVYTIAGVKSVSLTVTDSRGGSSAPDTDSVSVTTTAGNNPPTASFTSDPATGTAPLPVTFNGSASSDPDGPLSTLSFDWDWGDGTAHGSGASAGHTFTEAGTFTVTLTVVDQGGLTATASMAMVVVPLNCDVTGGWFNNPGSNATANDVLLAPSSKPSNPQFVFTATTNIACTTVTAKVALSTGFFTVPLTVTSTSGNTKTWSGVGSITDKMNVGSAQTASMSATDGVVGDTFSYAFSAHN